MMVAILHEQKEVFSTFSLPMYHVVRATPRLWRDNRVACCLGNDPAPCNCTVSTTDNPAASTVLPRLDPSAPTWLPQEIGTVGIAKMSDDADWLKRDVSSDAATIEADASQTQTRTAKILPTSFDSTEPVPRESLEALRSDGGIRSAKETTHLVSNNTVTEIEDSMARAREHVSLDDDAATALISHREDVVKPKTGDSEEESTGPEEKLSACRFSLMPGLPSEEKAVCSKRQGTPDNEIITSVPADHVNARFLGAKKLSSVVNARIAVATPRMRCPTSDIDSFGGDAVSHAERLETKSGTISPRDLVCSSNSFKNSEKLDVDAGAPASSQPSQGETTSIGSGIYSEGAGEHETATRVTASARSGSERHHRRKRRQHRDKNESESKSRSGNGQNQNPSGEEEVSEERARGGEGDVASDVCLSPCSSPPAQVLAPLNQTSPPSRMDLSGTASLGGTSYSELSLAATERAWRSIDDHDDGTLADEHAILSKPAGTKTVLANDRVHR